MWESPIMIYQTAMNGITTEIEGQIIAEIKTQVGIDINKEELIRAINYDRDQYNKGYQDGLNADRWIPVERELPKEKGEYFVTYRPCYWDDVKDAVLVGVDTFMGKKSWAKKKYQKVIAWMPKPAPYKEEREEEDE